MRRSEESALDGRGFDSEDLLGLSDMGSKIFLKDPKFGVSNIQILFLLRDWKYSKENLSNAAMVSALSNKVKKIRS